MGKRINRHVDRTLLKADENGVYGIIIKNLGHNKFQVYCSDTLIRIASIRGSMIKRVWIKEKDIVLCSLREGNSKFCDIECKYTEHEIKILKDGNDLTQTFLRADLGDVETNSKIDFEGL